MGRHYSCNVSSRFKRFVPGGTFASRAVKFGDMNVLFQLLSDQELPSLLEMMREFYAEQHMRFDESVARTAINRLLHSPQHGQIYLIFRGSALAGYFALTFCFSLEFHGRFGLLDELYLREPFRRQ